MSALQVPYYLVFNFHLCKILKVLVYVLVSVRAAKVGYTAVVVEAKVLGTAAAHVADVVHTLLSLVVSAHPSSNSAG